MSTKNSSRFTPVIIAVSVVVGILIGTFYAKHFAYDASVEKSVYELNDANMPVAYMNYKWNDKWIEESAASWAMNVSTPATNEATLLTASR